jgi:hypothetical protein
MNHFIVEFLAIEGALYGAEIHLRHRQKLIESVVLLMLPSARVVKERRHPARHAQTGLGSANAHPGQGVVVHADGDVFHRTNFVFHELRVKGSGHVFAASVRSFFTISVHPLQSPPG